MKKLAAVTVILGAIHLTDGQPCPPGTYRDHVTTRCDPCSDICQFKEITRTVEECLIRCPDYGKGTLTSTTRAPVCKDDQIYSVKVSGCVSCVCDSSDRHTYKRSVTQCNGICEEKNTSPSKTTMAIIVLCVTIVVVVPVALVWLFCWKHRRGRHSDDTTPPSPAPRVPHPTVTYVPVPLHVQCEDNSVPPGHVPIQEQEKFPSAFPDLPISARLQEETI